MSYDDPVDLSNTPARTPPSIDPAWRMRAVELAVERHLIGQAQLVRVQQLDPADPTNVVGVYAVVSASEPEDHEVNYYTANGAVLCDCYAGVHERPCSHAGAVLLHAKGLAPARQRNAEGFTRGTP